MDDVSAGSVDGRGLLPSSLNSLGHVMRSASFMRTCAQPSVSTSSHPLIFTLKCILLMVRFATFPLSLLVSTRAWRLTKAADSSFA